MPQSDSLRRLGAGRWETRDGRFAIEPQSGTWVIVDNEQTDELGLPLVRGPFGSLTAAKEAIESARSEGPKASPLADRIEQARRSDKAPTATKIAREPRRGAPGAPEQASSSGSAAKPGKSEPARPEAPPEPKWLRDLEPAARRRARDLLARLERMGVEDPERIVRAEIADGQPALARLAIERAIAKSLAAPKDSRGAARAVVKAILHGADVELGVDWKLVDDQGRRIDKVIVAE